MRARFATSTSRLLTCLALLTLLVSCGGGGSSAAPGAAAPPTSPPPAAEPTASFTAAPTATTNAPIAFDASTSTSSSANLQYVWDFGDGTRGGGVRIAHAYATAGTRTVTLTVVDAAGLAGTATHSVAVSAAAAATGTAVVHAAVVDLSGAVLSGVTIARQGSATVLGTTDATGVADVTLDRGVPFALRLAKPGYADQVMAVQLPVAAGTDSRINAVMRPRDAAQTLTDAHAGGTLAGRGGAAITLPADALVDSAGTLVTGAVSIAMTPVDPTLTGGGGFPGSFDGVKADASTTPIVSFGTVEFVLGSDGARLQLAPGKTATIELPMYATRRLDGTVAVAGDSIALWSLDETTALWTQEGTGTVVDNATSPTGLALRAVVSHFSWWNTDLGFDPYGPKPKCVYDDDIGLPEARDSFNNATMCNMLAEMARTLGGNATATRVRRQADPVPAAIAGYSRQVTVPISGGAIIPVPANRDVVLSATALNGTWTGSAVVNGPVGRAEDVLIKMRPIAVSGPTTEAITFPLDITRSIQPAKAAHFSFTSSATQTARFTVGAPGSQVVVSGTARILQGSTVIASSPFSSSISGTVVLLQPVAPGNYILEVETQQFAGVRIQGALLGGTQDDTLALPSDVTRPLPAYTLYRAGFDVASPAGAHFAAQGNGMNMRLLAPDGSVIWSKRRATGITLVDISLPVAGRYTYTAIDDAGDANSLRLTAELSDWAPVSESGAVGGSLVSVLDLVADRNGKPVLGHVTNPAVGSRVTQVLQLRRFTGSAWEDLGGPITSDLSCEPHSASIAFDSSNTPTIVYQSRTVADDYRVTVSRLVNGVWTGVGPNAGVLPHAASSGAGSLCVDRNQPRLTFDMADRPVVAYRDNILNLWVQRFDGTAWGKLAATATESFPTTFNVSDLRYDPSGTLWLVYPASNDVTPALRAARFDVASGNWQAAGPNNGALPESNTAGWNSARVSFDAAGRPVIAGSVNVLDSTRTSSSTGTVVYRFDGSRWVSNGGYTLPNSYVQGGSFGFAMLGNDALLSWGNQNRGTGYAITVQRNTASGWSSFGGTPNGALTAYVAHGLTPERALFDSRLLVVGTDVYLAAAIPSPQGTNPAGTQVVLMKKLR